MIGNKSTSVSVAPQQVDVPMSSFNAYDSSISWILDSGAGRTQIPHEHHGPSDNPVNFSTGGGKRPGNVSCRISGEFSGDNECYLLESSPWALSLGEMVRKGKAFVWLPATKPDDPLPPPFVVSQHDVSHLSVNCPEDKKIYATKVTENVPFFEEHVRVSHMPVAETQERVPDEDIHGEDSFEYEPSIAPDSDDAPQLHADDKLPIAKLMEATLLQIQRLLRMKKRFRPKCLATIRCSTCQKIEGVPFASRPARRIHEPHVLSDGEPAAAFGDRIHADHIIVAKSRLDRHLLGMKGERVVLILWDEFTKLVAAYPVPSKSTAECVKALRHFIGRRSAVELRADNAVELEAAAHELGLVYAPTVPYRKTATINRKIRTIEDAARCALVQGGRVHKLWPLAMQFFVQHCRFHIGKASMIVNG